MTSAGIVFHIRGPQIVMNRSRIVVPNLGIMNCFLTLRLYGAARLGLGIKKELHTVY